MQLLIHLFLLSRLIFFCTFFIFIFSKGSRVAPKSFFYNYTSPQKYKFELSCFYIKVPFPQRYQRLKQKYLEFTLILENYFYCLLKQFVPYFSENINLAALIKIKNISFFNTVSVCFMYENLLVGIAAMLFKCQYMTQCAISLLNLPPFSNIIYVQNSSFIASTVRKY